MIHLLFWLAGVGSLIGLCGFVYQALGSRRDLQKFPAPGRFVDMGTHKLHLLESGQKEPPTIVLEAGLMSTNLSWTNLQTELAKSCRVVSYDRAGLGWSDVGPMPRTADRIVEELHTLLQRAAIPGPYVLVGHSFGGLTMPLFAARFPEEVAGVVLVDPVVPAEWDPPSEHDRRQTIIGAKICRRAAFFSKIGVIRFIAFLLSSGVKKAGASLVRLMSRGSPGESGTVSSPWFAALPAREKEMAQIFWIQPKFAVTIASQLENLPASAARVAECGAFCDKPVVLLSARTAPEHRRNEHAAIAKRLPLGQHVLAEQSNHWIMQEQPELVLQAIAHVIESSPMTAPTRDAKVLVSSARSVGA